MTSALWSAPLATGPVRGTVVVPGSKSATNRALVLSALAAGPSRIRRPLHARDTKLMAEALRALGTTIDEVTTDDGVDWVVTPGSLHGPATIDCGLAGTVMRFVPAVAALANGSVRFDGDARARQRPMRGTIDALRALGVDVDDHGKGALPFIVHGTGQVMADQVTLDASASSQFVSALLLVAPRFQNGCVIHHRGEPIPSLPHLSMSVQMLRERGVAIDLDITEPTRATWHVHPGDISGLDSVIEPDLSNAAPFMAAAMVTGGQVTIPHWPSLTTQPGDRLRTLFTHMGGTVTMDSTGCTITGPDKLHGIDVDLRDEGELTPVIAAVCAFAATPSTIRGVGHLRGHETDRLAALVTEINRIGGNATETTDGIHIEPSSNWHGATMETYEDHRMATAAAVIGLRVPDVTVVDIDTTSKTLPNFDAMWHALLAGRP